MTAWNPSDKDSAITLSGSNLVATATNTSWKSVRADTSASTGKRYYEGKVTAGSDGDYMLGVGSSSAALYSYCGVDAFGWSWGHDEGAKWHTSVDTILGTAPTLNDVIMVAWDADSGKLWFGKNNTWFGSGDPAGGTNPAFTDVTGTLFPMVSIYTNNSAITAHFSQESFTYSPPAGFFSYEYGTEEQPLILLMRPAGLIPIQFYTSRLSL